MKEQNRKEHVQLIITLNQKGQPVYVNGAPALLEASLRRLQNVLQGQVLHCGEAVYNACKAFHPAPHVLDDNGSHIDDITKAWREDNWDYQTRQHHHEIGHWMVDYEYSHLMTAGYKSQFLARGFVSRLHVAQYFDTSPVAGARVGEGLLDAAHLYQHGYELELSEYETLNHRAGGPNLAKLRHLVYRHNSVPKHYPTLLSVDDPVGAAQAAARTKRDIERRSNGIVEQHIADPAVSFVHARNTDVVDPITGYRRPVWG